MKRKRSRDNGRRPEAIQHQELIPGVTTGLVDPKRARPPRAALEDLLVFSGEEKRLVRQHSIAVAADHLGASLGRGIVAMLRRHGARVLSIVPSAGSVNAGKRISYPVAALPGLVALTRGEVDRVILICGNGIGMREVAEAWTETRVCYPRVLHEVDSGRSAEDANVLVLGARQLRDESRLAELFCKSFLTTDYVGTPRKYRRSRRLTDRLSEIRRSHGADLSWQSFAGLVDEFPELAVAKSLFRRRPSGGARSRR